MLCCLLLFMDALTVSVNRHFSSAHRISFFSFRLPYNLKQNPDPLSNQAVRLFSVFRNNIPHSIPPTPVTCHLTSQESQWSQNRFLWRTILPACLRHSPSVRLLYLVCRYYSLLPLSNVCGGGGIQTGNNGLATLIQITRCLVLAGKSFQSMLCFNLASSY